MIDFSLLWTKREWRYKSVTEDVLVSAGVVRRKQDGIKLLATGELKDKVNLTLTKVTKGAEEAVTKAGGKVTLIEKTVAPVKKRGEKAQAAK